jgi:hypothetical protein
MITLTVIAILLFPSNAWATQKLQLDPNTLGAILAALLTTLGGGGYYLKRHRDVKDGRDDLSTKTKIAIARDNAEQVIREKVRDYHDEVANLRRDLMQLQQVATTALQASQSALAEVKELRQEMDQRFRDNSQSQQLERLLGPLSDLESKLSRAIEITERKGGGYGNE